MTKCQNEGKKSYEPTKLRSSEASSEGFRPLRGSEDPICMESSETFRVIQVALKIPSLLRLLHAGAVTSESILGVPRSSEIFRLLDLSSPRVFRGLWSVWHHPHPRTSEFFPECFTSESYPESSEFFPNVKPHRINRVPSSPLQPPHEIPRSFRVVDTSLVQEAPMTQSHPHLGEFRGLFIQEVHNSIECFTSEYIQGAPRSFRRLRFAGYSSRSSEVMQCSSQRISECLASPHP
ncbi:hypothetical protein PIB30_050693 [Stylosanthes scabra]|uniref:Uncharacterized protein n=1 Tax=Stylosanthes scabra TaxID=79078 RepID=A0ABU6SIB3_9FABA|nr:hypothetical protein [Stylosanthes scabra]